MDQRPGQHIDLGLYFHREGPVSPKLRLKNRFLAEKIRNFQKTYSRVPLSERCHRREYIGYMCIRRAKEPAQRTTNDSENTFII